MWLGFAVAIGNITRNDVMMWRLFLIVVGDMIDILKKQKSLLDLLVGIGSGKY